MLITLCLLYTIWEFIGIFSPDTPWESIGFDMDLTFEGFIIYWLYTGGIPSLGFAANKLLELVAFVAIGGSSFDT